VDPVSVVVTAVALGASAGLTETATAAIKDAYAALKGLLSRRSVDVSGLERRPESTAQRAALEETLTEAAAVDAELLAVAQRVTDLVADHRPEVSTAIGVDLERVRAEFVRIRSVRSEGTGVRARDIDVAGGFEIGEVVARPAVESDQQDGDPSRR
jgi:hypothetical protein